MKEMYSTKDLLTKEYLSKAKGQIITLMGVLCFVLGLLIPGFYFVI